MKTYLINIVKEENTLSKLTNLNYLFNVFEREGLENFAEKLYDVVSKKDDNKEANWAIRFCALLGSENLIKEMTNFIIFFLTAFLIESLYYKKNRTSYDIRFF